MAPTKGQKQQNELNRLDKWFVSALKFDVDSLARRYCESDDNSLIGLRKLLSETEFPTIYFGRFSTADLVEFTENLLIYAAHFIFTRKEDSAIENAFIKDDLNSCHQSYVMQRPFKERIFGIYVTFFLYFMQPHPFVMPVRISIQQMDSLHNFMRDVLLPNNCFEPLYCIYRLFDSNAFTIIPLDGSFNPLLQRKYDFNEVEATMALTEEFEENFTSLKSLTNDSLTLQADALHKRYNEAKKIATSFPASSLHLKNDSPLVLLQGMLTVLQKDLANNYDSTNDETHLQSQSQSRRSIRENAYTTTISRKRHRVRRESCGEKRDLGNSENYATSIQPLPSTSKSDDTSTKVMQSSSNEICVDAEYLREGINAAHEDENSSTLVVPSSCIETDGLYDEDEAMEEEQTERLLKDLIKDFHSKR